jgi:hypothetical protein
VDPDAERKKKEEEDRIRREAEEKAKRELEERMRASAAAAASVPAVATTPTGRNNPPPVVINRPATGIAPPPVQVVAAPAAPMTPITRQGAAEAAQGAVSNLLRGEFGVAINALENPTVAQNYGNNAGYYVLLAYGYYCRSFAQPDRASDFESFAKQNVRSAAKKNPNYVPDAKLFPKKFIEFYRNNI